MNVLKTILKVITVIPMIIDGVKKLVKVVKGNKDKIIDDAKDLSEDVEQIQKEIADKK